MQFLIRSARPDESAALTELARAAKASHGYPPEWLRQWEPELQLTPDYLGAHRVFVAERRHVVTGVVALEERPVGWSLEHLWVDPAMQNQGVGRALVLHALATARALKPGPVTLTADPGAAAFYERLGARRVGEQPAPMPGEPGRALPLFEFPTAAVASPRTASTRTTRASTTRSSPPRIATGISCPRWSAWCRSRVPRCWRSASAPDA